MRVVRRAEDQLVDDVFDGLADPDGVVANDGQLDAFQSAIEDYNDDLDRSLRPRRLEDFMGQSAEGLASRGARTLGRLGLGFLKANTAILCVARRMWKCARAPRVPA